MNKNTRQPTLFTGENSEKRGVAYAMCLSKIGISGGWTWLRHTTSSLLGGVVNCVTPSMLCSYPCLQSRHNLRCTILSYSDSGILYSSSGTLKRVGSVSMSAPLGFE